jgi:hypothetical protein
MGCLLVITTAPGDLRDSFEGKQRIMLTEKIYNIQVSLLQTPEPEAKDQQWPMNERYHMYYRVLVNQKNMTQNPRAPQTPIPKRHCRFIIEKTINR